MKSANFIKDSEVAEFFPSNKDPEIRYEERREIGHGAFGAVYYALDQETNEAVAIKVMSYGGKQSSDKWTDIIREIRLLKGLKHDNIVSFKASYLLKHDQKCWLVMEYCIGSAADILKLNKKPFKEHEIAEICGQTLRGLSYLHQINRIHRDIKAANILLTDSGIVKLGDLGSASIQCRTQSFVGSAYWMAPEVIMACEYGDYDIRADIWSFGITCIELAMKPPLLEMNTFSALYHIVQNDPPCLLNDPKAEPWSEYFCSFTEQCLRKDPNQRLSTNACLNHPFITNDRSQNLMVNLIGRMKKAVHEFDRSQCGKIRMILNLDELNEIEQPSEDVDNVSDRSSNKNNTLDQEKIIITQDSNKTIISLEGNGSVCSSNFEEPTTSNHQQISLHYIDLQSTKQQTKDEIINTLRRSKFSTLRTTKLVAREVQEYNAELYEQMVGYKRLRQNHHKELKQTEERCKTELDSLRKWLDKEFDQLNLSCQKEYTKVKSQLRTTLEKKLQENTAIIKKFKKNRVESQKHALRCYDACQKREYKFKKELVKNDLKTKNISKSNFDTALKIEKAKLKELGDQAKQKYDEDQHRVLGDEMVEFRRQLHQHYHTTESDLVKREMDVRDRQIDSLHSLLIKHFEVVKEQELAHFRSIEQLRKRHLAVQHDMEQQNQRDSNKRALEEKRKEHTLQSKQQPRDLKAKEAMIRKQFRQTVKTQTRQFKIYQTQMLQTVPREEQKDLLNRLRDEQNRKVGAVADLYENTINKMITEQTIKLDTQQEEDLRQLNERLDKELNLLTEYQNRQTESLLTTIERERIQLESRINLRRAILDEKMKQEINQSKEERNQQLMSLTRRQENELKKLCSPDARDFVSLKSGKDSVGAMEISNSL